VLLAVVVHCPHFVRSVTAMRNMATDRLVSCSDSGLCATAAGEDPGQSGEHDRVFPRGCPVFPSLAKQ